MHVRSWPNKLVWRDDGFGWLYAVVVSLHKWGGWLHAGNRHTHETRGYGQTANWHKSGVPSKHGRGRGSAPLILGTSWYSGTNLHAPQVSPPAVGGNLRIATMHPWLFSQVVIVGFFPGEYAVFVERILNPKFVFMYSHTLRCICGCRLVRFCACSPSSIDHIYYVFGFVLHWQVYDCWRWGIRVLVVIEM